MDKRITIKDVARLAGVSDTTVSRVIHDDSRISAETKKVVQAAIEELKYKPNLVARGLVSNRTQTIALISPELHPYVQPLVRGVSDGCIKNQHAMMLFAEGTWVKELESLAFVAQIWRVDGALFYHVVKSPENKITEEMRKLVKDMRVVFLNKFLLDDSLNVVGVDNYHGMELVIDHLIAMGHKRIGLLTAGEDALDSEIRKEAFKEIIAKRGLPSCDDLIRCGHFRESDAYEQTKLMLREGKPPTAIACLNDLMAFGAIAAIEEEGLVVPDDIAVTGFDDTEGARYVRPSLTTVRQPMEEMGVEAVELLLKVLRQPSRTPEQIMLKPELIVRQSTDPKYVSDHLDMAEERDRRLKANPAS